jgi:hypothetical protein
MSYRDSAITPQEIADGFGNRKALDAENDIKKAEAEMKKNDSLVDSGELEFDDWQIRQEALREQIKSFRKIILYEQTRFRELMVEREGRKAA